MNELFPRDYDAVEEVEALMAEYEVGNLNPWREKNLKTPVYFVSNDKPVYAYFPTKEDTPISGGIDSLSDGVLYDVRVDFKNREFSSKPLSKMTKEEIKTRLEQYPLQVWQAVVRVASKLEDAVN